ncbi:MAG TPA: SBBP repeat-containing protein [Candidatus Acidoferrales bacterium]|nr:SBBP repeat-containing protein [Candidatus Acidoferrales bacterium]
MNTSNFAAALNTITLNPATLNGGQSSTATVTLTEPAPTGGFVVTLATSSSSVMLPTNNVTLVMSVTVPYNATSMTFPIQTLPVGSSQTAVISASNGTTELEATLTINSKNPLSVTAFTTNAASVTSGGTVVGTITLNAPAYSPGQQVFIASSDMSVQPQNPVTVPTNGTTVEFNIFTSPIAAQRMVTVTATLNASSISVQLMLTPTGTAITSLLVVPYTVAGGQSMVGTLTISTPAPAGGETIAVTATFANSATPTTTPIPFASCKVSPCTLPNVQISAGSAQAQFTITSTAVTTTTDVVLTATLNTSEGVFVVEIVPALTLAGINCQLITVTSGDTDMCSVSLSIPAPTGGQVVQLTSSYPTGLTVPASVTVPAGASSVPLNLLAGNVTAPSIVTLTANLPATPKVTVTTTITVVSVNNLTLTSFTVNPTILLGGGGAAGSATGTVTLSSPGPPGGIAISLESSDPSVQLPNPPTVTVLQNAMTASFPITTTAVTSQTNVTLTASVNFSTSTLTLIVVPPPILTGIMLNQTTVVGGNSVVGTVTLATVAPQSGVAVSLCAGPACPAQSSSNLAQIPATITVPSGSSSIIFSITTLPVTTQQCGSGCNVTIMASIGASSQQAILTITPPPPDLQLLFFNPPTVTTGLVSTGTVTLTAQAPTGGVLVFLASNSATVTVPASVLVPAGSTSATFPARAATGVTTITTAQVNGTVVALATNTLTVIPAQTATLSEQVLLTGETNSTDFPVHGGPSNTAPFQSTLASGDDTGFLTSIGLSTPVSGATTSSYTFSTFLGGMSSFGQVRDVFVSSTGNVYACGVTMDGTLPTTKNAAQSAYGGGKDAFIAEFNSSGALQYLSYLGGAGDETCNSVTVDSNGNIYVLGSTTNSAAMGASNLTGTSGAFQTANAGGNDFFVAKINPTGTGASTRILWLTLVGGVADDLGNGRIAVNPAGVVAVTGTSQSTGAPPGGFPISGSQARPTLTGVGTMGVVLTISLDGSTLQSTTLLYGKVNGANPGTPTTTTASGGLRFDTLNNLYVCGATNASDLPVSAGAFQPALKGQQDGYVAIINYNGAITGVTYLGGTSPSGVQACKGITFDSEKNVVIAMPTDAADYPVTSTIPSGLVPGGQSHFAVTKLTSDLSTLVFSTLMGGSGSESADATRLVLDGSENLYFSLATTSGDFPVTANAVQATFAGTPGGSNTNVVLVKLSANGSGILYGSYLGGSSNNSTTSVFYLLN